MKCVDTQYYLVEKRCIDCRHEINQELCLYFVKSNHYIDLDYRIHLVLDFNKELQKIGGDLKASDLHLFFKNSQSESLDSQLFSLEEV